MSEPLASPQRNRTITLWDLWQLLTAVGILLAVWRYLGVFWVMIAVPVLFAATAAIRFSDVDRVTDMRLKRLMNLLTLAGCLSAWLYHYFVETVR